MKSPPLEKSAAGIGNPAREASQIVQPDNSIIAQSQTPAKTNHGFLHRVPKSHPKGPDMGGTCWIEGAGRFELAGWVNVSKRGKKYLSLKFKPAEDS
jgi:hypothetical protein